MDLKTIYHNSIKTIKYSEEYDDNMELFEQGVNILGQRIQDENFSEFSDDERELLTEIFLTIGEWEQIIMYVDERLVAELVSLSGTILQRMTVADYLQENATFYTLEEAKEDQECETLEEVMECFFLVVDGDEMKFVGDEIFDKWF